MTDIEILTAIGGTKSLSTLDGLRPGHLDRLGGRASSTDEQASALAETLEGRKREVRGIDTVAIRAPQVVEAARKQGRLEPFSTQAEGGAVAEPARVDRAAADSGGVRPHAAATRQPVHDRRAGGVADRRRRRKGPSRLHDDLGRDRGAVRGVRSRRRATPCAKPPVTAI